MPEGWVIYSSVNDISFYKPNFKNDKLQIEKQLIFKKNLEISFYVYQYTVDTDHLGIKLQYPLDPKQITAAIKMFEIKTICIGGPNPVNFPGIILHNRYSIVHTYTYLYMYIIYIFKLYTYLLV